MFSTERSTELAEMHKIKWPRGIVALATSTTLAISTYIALDPPYSFSVRGMYSIGKPCRAVEQVNPITTGPCLGELNDAKLKKTLRISYGLDTTSWPRLDGAMLITYPPGKSRMTEYGVWTTPYPVWFVVDSPAVRPVGLAVLDIPHFADGHTPVRVSCSAGLTPECARWAACWGQKQVSVVVIPDGQPASRAQVKDMTAPVAKCTHDAKPHR